MALRKYLQAIDIGGLANIFHIFQLTAHYASTRKSGRYNLNRSCVNEQRALHIIHTHTHTNLSTKQLKRNKIERKKNQGKKKQIPKWEKCVSEK